MNTLYEKERIKYTVQAIILNDDREVLAVSRKDDHDDFGLAGGKVDSEDYEGWNGYTHLEMALIREVKEETGLDIDMTTAEMVFAIHKDGYMGYTFLIKEWSGEIQTDEPHVVKWTHFNEIIDGSFGRYNSLVLESLGSMGIEVKIHPTPTGKYVFTTHEDEYGDFDGIPYFCLSPYYEDEEDSEWSEGHWPEGMWDEVMILLENAKLDYDIRDEQCFTLIKNGKNVMTIKELEGLLISAKFITDKHID